MKRHSGIRLALCCAPLVLVACSASHDQPPRRAADAPRLPTSVGCPGDRGDCDGLTENGCEVDLDSDAAHCGSCEQSCLASNVESALCVAAHCKIDRCTGVAGDCDGRAENGCEGEVCQSSHGPECLHRCKDPAWGYQF